MFTPRFIRRLVACVALMLHELIRRYHGPPFHHHRRPRAGERVRAAKRLITRAASPDHTPDACARLKVMPVSQVLAVFFFAACYVALMFRRACKSECARCAVAQAPRLPPPCRAASARHVCCSPSVLPALRLQPTIFPARTEAEVEIVKARSPAWLEFCQTCRLRRIFVTSLARHRCFIRHVLFASPPAFCPPARHTLMPRQIRRMPSAVTPAHR